MGRSEREKGTRAGRGCRDLGMDRVLVQDGVGGLLRFYYREAA